MPITCDELFKTMDLNKDDNKVSGVVYVNENYKYMLQVKDLRREPC